MSGYIPQDEYFEWEDILVYRQSQHITHVEEMGRQISISEYQGSFTPSLDTMRKGQDEGVQWSEMETGAEQENDFAISWSRCTSVFEDTKLDSDKSASPIDFPCYDDQVNDGNGPKSESTQQGIPITKDDSEAYILPVKCVDYFSHVWNEEEMLASWRHLRIKEQLNKNVGRLQNASWRLWARTLFNLKTVSPQTVNWMKDVDDICLYGPLQAIISSKQVCTSSLVNDHCATTKSILKKPRISQLLLQGSHWSWTGSRTDPRRHSAGTISPTKRSVRFNDIIEQCITIEDTTKGLLPRSKGALFKTTSSLISSAPVSSPTTELDNSPKLNFWSPPTFSQPQTSNITAPSNISEWTWLGANEEEELDWISPPPTLTPSAYTFTPPKPTSIVRDTVAKSHYTPQHRPGSLPLREYSWSDEEDEDEMIAQYLFDCDFKSDTDSLSPSESCSSIEDRDEEEVDFFDGGDLADEKRMMERLHEIPMMESMKQSLFDQVVDEVSSGWE